MLREIAVACEDASWDDDVRAVVVTGTGRAFCVGADLRTLGRRLPGQPVRLLEVVRRLQGHARPPAGDRQADHRPHQRHRRRRRQRAADGVRPRGDRRRRLHPPRRARARQRPRRRRDAVAAADGRRPPCPRDRPALRRDPRTRRQPSGGSSTARCPAAELDSVGRRVGGEPRAQAAAGDPVRQAAAQRVARPRLAPDGRPRPRLARAVDALGRDEGRRATVPRPGGKE